MRVVFPAQSSRCFPTLTIVQVDVKIQMMKSVFLTRFIVFSRKHNKNTRARAFGRQSCHIVYNLYGPSCRCWAHRRTNPFFSFRLRSDRAPLMKAWSPADREGVPPPGLSTILLWPVPKNPVPGATAPDSTVPEII